MNLLDEFTVGYLDTKSKNSEQCYQPNKGRYVKFFHVYVAYSGKLKIDKYEK